MIENILNKRYEYLLKKHVLLWMINNPIFTKLDDQRAKMLEDIPMGSMFVKILEELFDEGYVTSTAINTPYSLTQKGHDFHRNYVRKEPCEIQEMIDHYNKAMINFLKKNNYDT